MFDPISKVTSAISAGKALFDIAQKMKHVELQQAILELNTTLLDLKGEIYDLKNENQKLTQEMDVMRKQRRPEDALRIENGKYFLKSPAEGQHPGPYCVRCFCEGGKLVPLGSSDEIAFGAWMCPVCERFAH